MRGRERSHRKLTVARLGQASQVSRARRLLMSSKFSNQTTKTQTTVKCLSRTSMCLNVKRKFSRSNEEYNINLLGRIGTVQTRYRYQ